MANVNAPFGLTPVSYLNGSPWNGQARLYYIASTNTDAFFIGDPVKSSGDGSADGVAGVALGTAGTAIRGVIVSMGGLTNGGFLGDPDSLSTISIPATKTKNYYVLVVDDPSVIFACQEDGTAMTSADIGLNANFVVGTPATGVKVSATEINNSTKATTSTLNLKLLGLVQTTDNAYGANADWLVLINAHELKAGTTGV